MEKYIYRYRSENGYAIFADDLERISFTVPAEQSLGMAQMAPMPVIESAEAYRAIVEAPVSGKRLREIAAERNAKSACILVSDASRKVPNAKFSGILIEELLAAGIQEENILFVVAIGVHRPATEAEMQESVGPEYYGRVRIENHTPFDKKNLVFLGYTKYGTPIEVNRRAWECDLHINIGKCEPHEFAGFSGGRKSVLPGISSEKTIVVNHRPKNLYSPFAVPGNLDNNPTHLDMLEAAKMFRIDFSVNLVMNDSMQVSAGFAGELEASHAAAVFYLRKYCGVELRKKPDIIVTTPGAPLNLDFYQSMKPLIALTEILDRNTAVILYSQCPEGVQSEDMLKPFEMTDSVEDIEGYLCGHYKIQMDHALLLAKILKKGVKIIVYSPNVSSEVIQKMHMIPCEDPELLLPTARHLCGKEDATVLFYPQPQKTLPTLRA